jgi:hypothetical protein
MKRYLVAYCVVAVAVLGSIIESVAQEASKTACFDIIIGVADTQPILLDHCSGQTWMLTRNGRRSGQAAYRWIPLATGSGEPPQLQSENRVVGSGKCFTFQGRRFCE